MALFSSSSESVETHAGIRTLLTLKCHLPAQGATDWGWQFRSDVCMLCVVKEPAVKALPGSFQPQCRSLEPFFSCYGCLLFMPKSHCETVISAPIGGTNIGEARTKLYRCGESTPTHSYTIRRLRTRNRSSQGLSWMGLPI
jgi:hypothetical protein